MKNIIKTTLMMLLAGTIITACDKKTEYPEPDTTAAILSSQVANVNYIHASPDAPEMKFFINNLPITGSLTSTLAYKGATGYTPFDVVNATRFSTTIADMTKTLFNYTGLDGVVNPIQSVAYRTSSGGIMGTGNFTAVGGGFYSLFLTEETTRVSNIQNGKSTDIGGPLLDYILDDASFRRFSTTPVPYLIPNPATGVIVTVSDPANIILPTGSAKLRFCNLSPVAPLATSTSDVTVVVTSANIQDTGGNVVPTSVYVPLPAVTGVIEAPSIVLSTASMNLFTAVRYRDLHANPRQTYPTLTSGFRAYRSLAYIPVNTSDNKLVLNNVEIKRTVAPFTTIFTIPFITIERGKAYTIVMMGRVGTPSFDVKVIKNN